MQTLNINGRLIPKIRDYYVGGRKIKVRQYRCVILMAYSQTRVFHTRLISHFLIRHLLSGHSPLTPNPILNAPLN